MTSHIIRFNQAKELMMKQQIPGYDRQEIQRDADRLEELCAAIQANKLVPQKGSSNWFNQRLAEVDAHISSLSDDGFDPVMNRKCHQDLQVIAHL